MTSLGTVGEICCQGDFKFDWKIQNFLSLPDMVDCHCRSPQFDFCGRSWSLRVSPNGQKAFQSEGFIGLFLMSGESGPPLELRYSLGVKVEEETEFWMNPTYRFYGVGVGFGVPKALLRSELLRRRDELMPQDVLTLTVAVKTWKIVALKKDASVQTAVVEHDVADVFVQTAVDHNVADVSCQTEVYHNLPDVSSQATGEDTVVNDGKCDPSEKTGGEKALQDIGKLWLSGNSSDVVLKVRDVKFKAHRAILAARTPVLCAMFKHNTTEKASGEVTIDDCEPAIFEQLLHFIYTGAPHELNAENASALYLASDKYLLSELKALCVRCMQNTLNLDTFCNFVEIALMHREIELLLKAVDFLSKNKLDVMKTVDWRMFLREHSTWANEILIRAVELEARNEKRKVI